MDHQQGFPGGLREIYSGWSASELDLVPGEGFWARIEQIAVNGEMTRGLDAALRGQSSPRIWLFLHEPGCGDLSAAVAMSFARELAFRDQAVLLLDCDDRDQALTRWAGRIEAEGWIDLARYGTSVLTSGVAMPFVGRRGYFLGVGSFAPTDVTGEEIDTLLTRLRRQGDDVLLVAPSDFPGLMWAPAAAIRIFCWDKQAMSENEAAIIAAGFAEAGCPLTAVATFHDAGPVGERLVEKVLTEVESGSAPRKPSPPDTPAPAAPVVSGATAEPDTEPVAAEDETESTAKAGWRDLPLEMAAEGADIDPGESDWVAPRLEPAPVASGDTSRVFWFGALAAVVLIAAISIYYFKFVRVPAAGPFEPIEVATQTAPPLVTGLVESSDEGNLGEGAAGTVAADSQVVAVEGENQPDATPVGTVKDSQRGIDSLMVATTLDSTPELPEEEPPAPVVSPRTGFDMEPYRQPVGAKGWALHVYSLPDSAATAQQVQVLSRRGFQSAVRAFDLGEKGTWNRIYLGSFSSRTQAKEAMPALLEKLREDWAKPIQF